MPSAYIERVKLITLSKARECARALICARSFSTSVVPSRRCRPFALAASLHCFRHESFRSIHRVAAAFAVHFTVHSQLACALSLPGTPHQNTTHTQSMFPLRSHANKRRCWRNEEKGGGCISPGMHLQGGFTSNPPVQVARCPTTCRR